MRAGALEERGDGARQSGVSKDRQDALEIAPNREALMMAIKGIGVS